MTSPLETVATANSTLDRWGNAVVEGANTAPRLTSDSIMALRGVLNRHAPVEVDRFRTVCAQCGTDWSQCSNAQDVLKLLGLPDDDHEKDY